MATSQINIKLAKRIKSLRTKKGLTQLELSELSGLDYKHVQNLESRMPDDICLSSIEKLARAFKITPSKLLDF
ncbi:MAG: hypothetical protein A3C47_00390 [Omnitrophica bacterium RIFCSPHIGHO2_02_FULL_51_18]|nr:MAG: hypothetical protein A3C47_00390 [Omnitrophica bacterium RIFCSPHIGHO2_02_FULL_51_18]